MGLIKFGGFCHRKILSWGLLSLGILSWGILTQYRLEYNFKAALFIGFRDDPDESLKCGPSVDLLELVTDRNGKASFNIQHFKSTCLVSLGPSLDPQDYCFCSQCKIMPTFDESFCCKNKKFIDKGGEKGLCAVDHDDFKIITHKVALEANLKSVWNAGKNNSEDNVLSKIFLGIFDTVNQDISNINLRYAAYRSLNGWICKGDRNKSLRSSLPSCIVKYILLKPM